jgi:uncharacterized protein (TIGR00369 family)
MPFIFSIFKLRQIMNLEYFLQQFFLAHSPTHANLEAPAYLTSLKNNNQLGFLPYPIHNPFLEHLGAQLIKCDAQGCLLYLSLAEHMTNSWGKAHGGVLMTVMDMAMSWSARAQHIENLGAATIEMKSTFMRAAMGDLWIAGSVTHKTSTLAFCQAHVYNTEGELCCHSTSTFKYSKRLIEVK